MASLSTAQALAFCRTHSTACILTVWPSGMTELSTARQWLQDLGGKIVHEARIEITPAASYLYVMALYAGEDWLESNCWYGEQPLPGGRPSGPFPGCQWKRELCFADGCGCAMHVLVFDAAQCPDIWTEKYSFRAQMASRTGNPGNSCIHLTDDQSRALRLPIAEPTLGGSGMACDASFAYVCARALLNPRSRYFLDVTCAPGEDPQAESWKNGMLRLLSDKQFVARFNLYTQWLADRSCEDTTEHNNGTTLFMPLPGALHDCE